MLIFTQFYRLYGIRKPSQLLSPIMTNIDNFELPRFSVYHYLNEDPAILVPTEFDPFIKNIKRPLNVVHLTALDSFEGNPRKLPISINTHIRGWQAKNIKRFRPFNIDNLPKFKDPASAVLMNYSPINRSYYYQNTVFKEYHKWLNLSKTIWGNIAKTAKEGDMNHFIAVNLPELVPTKSIFRIGSDKLTTKVVKLFNNDSSRFLLEIWKWLGDNRAESIISQVDYKDYKKVNIVFIDNGRFSVINLDTLNQWRNATLEEARSIPDAPTKGLVPERLQMVFIKLLKAMTALREIPDNEIEQVNIGDVDQVTDSSLMDLDTTDESSDGDGDEVETAILFKTKLSNNVIRNSTGSSDTDADIDIDTTLSAGVDSLDDLDNAGYDDDPIDDPATPDIASELQHLNKIEDELNQRTIKNKSIDLMDRSDRAPIEEGVKSNCDRLAELGKLTAAEYKRHIKLSESYKTIKIPGSNVTLDKFIKVDKTELKIEPKKLPADTKTIVDKTMLQTCVEDFNKKYITQIMQRDIAAMTLNIQNAGYSVTNYDVELVKSVTGDYFNYSVQVVPVEGKISTIKFRLPAVDEEGVFMAGSTKYMLRLQNGDVPIRKIAPGKVALSSYYGKVFATRCVKKVHDYYSWLAGRIMNAAIDDNNQLVTEANPGSCFNQYDKEPRALSGLSMYFTNFTAKGYKFILSKNLRPNGDHLKQYGDLFFIGYNLNNESPTTGQFIGMDDLGELYLCQDGIRSSIGTIEKFLGIDTTHAPVDFSELKVMGKHIPIGFILAYRLGFDSLLSSLSATYRIVEGSTRLNLEADEYAIHFADQSIVLSRNDRLATMILAGFNEYRNTLKMYSMHELNSPDVYLNILEAAKLTNRYLKEIDLLFDMFVDPITRDLLKDMNEPQTFHGLLVRASELVLYDEHPDEVDDAFMRRKGYERFSGIVYGELIKAIRQHKARPDKSRAQMSINPVSVWMEIAKDPSKILVTDINPLHNLKEHESLTYSGTGGRNNRSMVAHTRKFHKNGTGVVSEATSDSGDAGVNMYISSNPQFIDLRGRARKFDLERDGPAAVLSSSAMNAPYADTDDWCYYESNNPCLLIE